MLSSFFQYHIRLEGTSMQDIEIEVRFDHRYIIKQKYKKHKTKKHTKNKSIIKKLKKRKEKPRVFKLKKPRNFPHREPFTRKGLKTS